LKLALALLCVALAGCPSGLEEQSHIGKLRVLGMIAEPAELVVDLDAGTLPATTLTSITVLPDGGPTATRFALCTWIAPDPPPDLDCPGDAGIDLPNTGPDSARLDLNDPRLIAFAGSQQGNLGLLDQGIPLIIGFKATAGAETLTGFDSVNLRSTKNGPADANPPLLDLQIGDGGVPLPEGLVARLQPVTGAKDDPTKKYLFSFYATAGSISSLHSTDVTATGQAAETWVDWTTPSLPGTTQLWVTLRDGRGGVAFVSRTVTTK
jgi:hypothetical protein